MSHGLTVRIDDEEGVRGPRRLSLVCEKAFVTFSSLMTQPDSEAIRICPTEAMSMIHVLFERCGGHWYADNRGERFAATLNGQEMPRADKRTLHVGSVIGIGAVKITVEELR